MLGLACSVLFLLGYLVQASISLEKRLPSLSGFTYEGCYFDSQIETIRVLPVYGGSSARMTLEKCAAACTGYIYFGLQGYQCYCGNNLRANPPSEQVAGSGVCSSSCSGDSSQKCGSVTQLSLYRKNDEYNLPVPQTTTYKSVGCYYAPGYILTSEVSEWNINAINYVRCEDICAGYPFYALSRNNCFCAKKFHPSARLRDSTQCSNACTGDDQQVCGGVTTIWSVFSNLPACDTLNSPLRVQNPGFEAGTGSWATQALQTELGTPKWSSRTGIQYSGQRAARIDFPSPAGTFVISQNVPVCQGTAYMVSYYTQETSGLECQLVALIPTT